MELSPQVPQHLNNTPVAAQPQPVGMHVHQTPSSPTPPSGMVSSNSLPNMLNVLMGTNSGSGPPNSITSSAPAIPLADPKKVPETLQTSPSSTPEEVMEVH